ncbi:MAG: glycoside hydrolase family 76 protein [Chloroflexia bacterium]
MGGFWRAIRGALLGEREESGDAQGTANPVAPDERARAAYAALERHFARDDVALYREHAPVATMDRAYAYLWPLSQAWMAALDLAAAGDAAALERARELRGSFFAHYWDMGIRPPGGAAYPVTAGGGDIYYDDNAWIGLALIRLAELARDESAVADAARVFAFVASGWDDAPDHAQPGGIFWTMQPHIRDRNTCSNGPTALLALRLYEATGERAYLEWGRRLFGWVERALRDPADGLYWDHIKPDGAIERTKWSYNQGTMLGSAALLARVDDDAALLGRAREIALAALAHYAEGDRLWGQDPAFNGIFFENLHLLGEVAGDHGFYREVLAAYAQRAWAPGRDPRTGLCNFGRRGRVELLTQAAAVRVLALAAAVGEG